MTSSHVSAARAPAARRPRPRALPGAPGGGRAVGLVHDDVAAVGAVVVAVVVVVVVVAAGGLGVDDGAVGVRGDGVGRRGARDDDLVGAGRVVARDRRREADEADLGAGADGRRGAADGRVEGAGHGRRRGREQREGDEDLVHGGRSNLSAVGGRRRDRARGGFEGARRARRTREVYERDGGRWGCERWESFAFRFGSS